MSCPDCFKGGVHDHAKPRGTYQEFYGYKHYIATPPTGVTLSSSTIIFFTDAFGLNLPNNLILADHYAEGTGCRVLVPDIIPGGAAPLYTLHGMNGLMKPIGKEWAPWLNPLTYLSKGYNFFATLVGIVPFMIRGNAPKAWPACLEYARKVRADMPADGKLGAAGFCWGGYPSTFLCGETDSKTGKPILDAQFNAHPSFLKAPDDIVNALEKLKVPYSCAVAEFDNRFDKKASDETEAALKQKLGDGAGPYEFVIYKGCHHGFSVKANWDEGSVVKDGYEGAAVQAVNWFNKYLK